MQLLTAHTKEHSESIPTFYATVYDYIKPTQILREPGLLEFRLTWFAA